MDALQDRRRGKFCPHKAADEEVDMVTALYTGRYKGFSISHFHDYLELEHGLHRSYSWVRRALLSTRAVAVTKKGGKHRKRRKRKPMAGMMLHQDGSTHQWVEGVYWDLVVTMDDATSETTSAFFVEEEGTMSSFRGIQETIAKKPAKYGQGCRIFVLYRYGGIRLGAEVNLGTGGPGLVHLAGLVVNLEGLAGRGGRGLPVLGEGLLVARVVLLFADHQ